MTPASPLPWMGIASLRVYVFPPTARRRSRRSRAISRSTGRYGGADGEEVTSEDGTTIAFDRSGDGPSIVLVGGALADRSAAAQLAAQLAPHFTVIAYDRRGRGDSGDTAPYAVEREVEDIEGLIVAAGGQAFVLGHSSGAVLALESARTFPDRIGKLALYEPPFIVDDSRSLLPEDYVSRLEDLVSSGSPRRRGRVLPDDAVRAFPLRSSPGCGKSPSGPRSRRSRTRSPTTASSWETPRAAARLPLERWASVGVPDARHGRRSQSRLAAERRSGARGRPPRRAASDPGGPGSWTRPEGPRARARWSSSLG